jgi:AraC-like DNA-binding protein
MDFLRIPSTQSLVIGSLQKPLLSATRVSQSGFDHGMLDPHVVEDAFMVSFQHISLKGELWVDGKNVTPPQHRGGSIAIYDLRREWKANLLTPFDCVNFYLPRRILEAVSSAEGVSSVEDLYTRAGESIDDPTIRGLVVALNQALERPKEANTLFVDQLGLALASHLVRTYADASSAKGIADAPLLSPAQVNMIKNKIESNLDGGVSLPEISISCDLPIDVVVNGFTKAEGATLFRWLQKRRVEVAKELLAHRDASLEEIASLSGFSNIDQLFRVFEHLTGLSPVQWRSQCSIASSITR